MSANCIKQEKLQEYLDNALNVSEKHSVETHLSACAACRTEAEKFQRLYSAADSAVKNSVISSCRSASVDSVMRRLPGSINRTVKNSAVAESGLNFFDFLLRFSLPALIVAAIAILGILYSGRQPLSETVGKNQSQFSLIENSVLMVRGNMPAGLSDRLMPDTRYKLGRDDLMMVKVDQNRFEFSDAADFSFKNLQITVNSGEAAFELSGPHKGFAAITQNVTVTPLGTSFKLLVRDWGTRITLSEGQLQLETSSKLRRIIDKPSTLYVGTDGGFYDQVPQNPATKGTSQSDAPPAHYNRPAGGNNSPGTLLDSF